MPESPSRLRARYHALLASGLRPVTALAVSIAVIIGRAIPTLAVVAICGALIDGLGARTVGVVIAGGTLVLLCIGLLTLVIVCPVSDATQFWLRWNAANSSPCRTRAAGPSTERCGRASAAPTGCTSAGSAIANSTSERASTRLVEDVRGLWAWSDVPLGPQPGRDCDDGGVTIA
jgi:hypothetical protein